MTTEQMANAFAKAGKLISSEQKQTGEFPKTKFYVVFTYEHATAEFDGMSWTFKFKS